LKAIYYGNDEFEHHQKGLATRVGTSGKWQTMDPIFHQLEKRDRI